MLLAAGEPPPTTILVHEFLTVAGKKIGKSLGNAVDPRDLVQRYGADALRWWLLCEPSPVADTDLTVERLVARADQDLANGIGNLVSRTAAMVHRYRGGRVPNAPAVGSGTGGLAREVAAAVDRYDFRAATAALVAAVARPRARLARGRVSAARYPCRSPCSAEWDARPSRGAAAGPTFPLPAGRRFGRQGGMQDTSIPDFTSLTTRIQQPPRDAKDAIVLRKEELLEGVHRHGPPAPAPDGSGMQRQLSCESHHPGSGCCPGFVTSPALEPAKARWGRLPTRRRPRR